MTKAIETAVKILESLPEPKQESLVEELRSLACEVQDEAKWEENFSQSHGLRTVAQKVRNELAEGKASDMDFDQL